MSDIKKTVKAGYIAIVGRPNVGKSTLLNKIIGNKVSITSPNAQTTRGCVSANYTGDNFSIKLVDTPGYIDKSKHLLDRVLNKSAVSWIESVDLILFVIDAREWTKEDETLLQQINFDIPVILILNKSDLIKSKEKLLPMMKELSGKIACKEIVPISSITGSNISNLCSSMLRYLPDSHPLESHILLSTPKEIIISERIREKIFRYMSAEIPKNTVVVVNNIRDKKNVFYISARIVVSRKSHRKIVIGKDGNKLKSIGTSSREELEKIFNKKVYLELFVDVEENWVNKDHLIQEYQIFYNQQY